MNKQEPDYKNFRGEDALYSRLLQGLVDFLDEFPDKVSDIQKKCDELRKRIANLLGK